MKLKTFRYIKLGLVIAIAIIFSQSIIFQNYIIPIATLIIASLIMLYLRRQVKEIIADERDYTNAGKSALLAIQIFSWVAVIAMFIFYAQRDIDPLYEPIGMTLALSVCLLMLTYSIIFRIKNAKSH